MGNKWTKELCGSLGSGGLFMIKAANGDSICVVEEKYADLIVDSVNANTDEEHEKEG